MSRVPNARNKTVTSVAINGNMIDASKAPKDRTFRDNWQLDGNAIVVDMAGARETHRNRLRQDRLVEFARLDAEWFRAAENDDETKKDEIKAQKQKLRNVPADPRIEAASTPEELQALTLAILTE